MRSIRRLPLALIVLLVAALTAGLASAHPLTPARQLLYQDGPTPADLCADATIDEPDSREFDEAAAVLEDDVDYWAVICTEAGPIYLDLFEDRAPMTVNNFVFLAQQDYYNNTTFHRVLPGFMAQGGDPTGTGSGGPGYQFGDETDNGLTFDSHGLLAMANAGPGTNGSQFFITYAATPWLDGNHTIFGEVYAGIDNAELLRPRDPQQAPGFDGAALNTVIIVEDPASVSAEPDGAPSAEHIQRLLDEVFTAQFSGLFAVDETRSGVQDMAAVMAEASEVDGDLAAYLGNFLAAQGFEGTARTFLSLTECAPNLEDLPIWGLGVSVSDFGSAGAASDVVAEDELAALRVEAGLWDDQTYVADLGERMIADGIWDPNRFDAAMTGRIYQRAVPEADGCSAAGVFYRLDMPMGRYVARVSLILDTDYINAETAPTPEQYLALAAQDLVLGTINGTLARGNAALPAAE